MKKTLALLTTLLFACISNVHADDCTLVVEGNDQMKYNLQSMTAPASCEKVTITLKHVGKMPKKVMGHNWVLVKTADVTAVGTAAISAGMENNYVPQNDSRILAASSLVGGGESTSVEVDISKLDKTASYSFICTFPGHYAIMKGEFKIS